MIILKQKHQDLERIVDPFFRNIRVKIFTFVGTLDPQKLKLISRIFFT